MLNFSITVQRTLNFCCYIPLTSAAGPWPAFEGTVCPYMSRLSTLTLFGAITTRSVPQVGAFISWALAKMCQYCETFAVYIKPSRDSDAAAALVLGGWKRKISCPDWWTTVPSQHSDDVRDWQRSTEAPDGKYGHRDGPEQSDGLRGDRLIVPVDPGLIVKGFDVL